MKLKRIIGGLFSFAIVSLIFGCSGNSGSSDTKPMDTTSGFTAQPLTSQKVSLLTADHNGDISSKDASGKTIYALPSALFEEFGAGLIATPSVPAAKLSAKQVQSAPVGFGWFDLIVLGDMIYGIIEDVNGKKEQETQFTDLEDQLEVINAQIDTLGIQLGAEIDSSWSKLNLTAAQSLVFSANTRIDTMYNGTDQTSFLYFSHQRSLISACENIVATTGSSTACTLEQQNAYNSRTTLKSDAAGFAASVTSSGVRNDIATIHSSIVPSGNIQIFKALVSQILTENNPLPAPATEKAMYAYLLLESMFAQFLTHQYQGASMVVNAGNYDEKMADSAIGHKANNYMTGTYENYLREECAEFLAQVDWMVVNLHDYRNKDIYAADMVFMNQGLAPDPVFSDILARARFFCAQVLQPYNDNRTKGTNGTWAPNTQITSNVVGNGFGLKGAIVVPGDYTKKESVTLNFYDTNSKLVASTSATPKLHSGRYPYTKWVQYTVSGYNMGNMAAQAAYDWLVYDIDLSGSNLPAGMSAGTYTVRFVEKGKDPNGNAGPWVHADTLLGTVSLQYFDPKNPADGRDKADINHNRLFGSFSLYWPWNFQRFTTSPISRFTDSSLAYAWSAMTSTDKKLTFTPSYPEYTGLVNRFTYDLNKSKSKSDETYISIPFTIASATADVAMVYKSTGNQVHGYFPNASYMKSYSVGYSYKISTDKYPDVTIDSGKSAVTTNGNPDVWEANSVYQPFTMHNDDYYNLNVGVNFSSSYKSGWIVDVDSSADADLNWYMQLLFTDTKKVMDIQ